MGLEKILNWFGVRKQSVQEEDSRNNPTTQKQEFLLKLAEASTNPLFKIETYTLAGRESLAYIEANKALKKSNTTTTPYTPEEWKILYLKQEFDKNNFKYDSSLIKKGLLNTEIRDWALTLENLKTIKIVLAGHITEKDKIDKFFVKLRDSHKDTNPQKTLEFIFDGKETNYSSLASYTDVPREEVVKYYLRNFFTDIMDDTYRSIDTILSKGLLRLMEEENISTDTIVKEAISAMNNGKVGRMYKFINGLSKTEGVCLPKKLALRVAKAYAKEWAYHCEDFFKDELPPILKGVETDEANRLHQELVESSIENGGSHDIGDKIKYAQKRFGIDIGEKRFKDIIKRNIEAINADYYLPNIIQKRDIGGRYDLFSQKEISDLEDKINLIKSLKYDIYA